jgi:cytochrome c peroxidase
VKQIATIVWFAIALLSCAGDHVDPAQDAYAFAKPKNFPEAVYTFQNNPVTEEGFELGRALFYDPILSLDSTIACANCHQQARSFSDPVHRFSKGVNDLSGFRNAPALQNLAFQTHFFWDGGVGHLDFVAINAITSEVEMNEKLAHVVEKLQRSPFYKDRFKTAFGSTEVDSQKMLFALSQFMNMMISSNSRYDKYVRNEGEQLSSDELEGLVLFNSKCATCHATDLFTDGSFRNNGLDETFQADKGRERITEDAADIGKFKVPSLRNAELSSPYMHDGRFKTLAGVLDHYSSSVKNSETLDPLLRKSIPMTDDEKAKIILFIKTLTDRGYIGNRNFSNPFLK